MICSARTRPVAERLQRLLPHAAVEETDAYDLPAILARLNSLASADRPTVVNLTGGAKMMMAAFALPCSAAGTASTRRANGLAFPASA